MNKEIIAAAAGGLVVGGLIGYTSYKNIILKDIEELEKKAASSDKLKEDIRILEELIEDDNKVPKEEYDKLLVEANNIIEKANLEQLEIKIALEGILKTAEVEATVKEAVEEEVTTIKINEATIEITEDSIELNEDTLKLTIEEAEAAAEKIEAAADEVEKDK